MSERRFKDFYGCTASIKPQNDGTVLVRVCLSTGEEVKRKTFTTERGAKIALSKLSDSWREEK